MLLWLGAAALPSLLLISLPARYAARGRRLSWVSSWARAQCRLVLGILRLGGARSVRLGTVRTDVAGIILMNHQSLLDVPTAVLMCGPVVPAFVARERYARVPLISTGLRIADCPVVDPRRDRAAALARLRQAVRADRAILIYPEGHRSTDGALQPFRTAGLIAMLTERRVPVWLVATDGFTGGRRLVDLVQLHRIRGVTEVLGRFDPPDDEAAIPAFLDGLHSHLADGLARIRSRRAGGA
ncbi:MAG TPA: lysophospholipid acyltransferase family protein [Vicinamibacteria bacterium]|nr:lysophospholipid acyltransferase family protein [Vicinamibacteria bacterium]